MNILMLTYEIVDEGGNFIRCFSLAKNLVKLGHSVTILASNKTAGFKNKSLVRQGVTIIEIACPLPHRLRHNGTSPFQIIGRIIHVFKHRYDLVHGFGHRPAVSIPAYIFKFLFRGVYLADWADLWGWGGLASYRGGVWGNLTGFCDDIVERLVYRFTDGLTVISTFLLEKAVSYGAKRDKVYLLTVGANVDSIVPLSKIKSRKKLGLSTGGPTLVFVGNAKYDALLLAQCFIELVKLNPLVKLIFAGIRMPEFEDLVGKAKLENKVVYKGFVNNDSLGDILGSGDVMLLPYTDRDINRGRFPNKIGDYMSAGRPTVSNPTGDLKLMFAADKIGLLASENPKDMARAIQKILKNRKYSEFLGFNARRAAVKKYSWLLFARQLEEIYASLLSEKFNFRPRLAASSAKP